MRLLAVEAPKTARRGEAITLTWAFEAKGTVRGDRRVFANVEVTVWAGMFSGKTRATARAP